MTQTSDVQTIIIPFTVIVMAIFFIYNYGSSDDWSIPTRKKNNKINYVYTIAIILIGILIFLLSKYKDNENINKPILGVLVIIIAITIAYYLSTSKKQKIKKLSAAELWNNEIIDMNTPFTHTPSSESGEQMTGPPGISYSTNIKISDWMYDTNVNFREIFTHGSGSFRKLHDSDILSVAIDAHVNDMIIEVNTIEFIESDKGSCSSFSQSDKGFINTLTSNQLKNIGSTEIKLKNFPLDKYFHLIIVLSKNRIDTYIDGKLHVTKILPGYVNLPYDNNGIDTDSLLKKDDIIFFQGSPIKGEMHDFMYFRSELSLKLIQDIYAVSKMADIDDYTENLNKYADDYKKIDFLESQCN